MPETPSRPSVMLHGFQGGIVYNEKVALRLAQVLFGGSASSPTRAGRLPLEVRDHGNTWVVVTVGSDTQSGRSMEIRKRDAAVLSLDGQSPPELLGAAATAQHIAAVLADSAGDPDEAVRQQPFTVTDRGETWIVRGSGNADRAVEGPGPFYLEVQKRDARVLDMHFEAVIHTPPEVKELLRAAAARAKG